MFKVLCKIWQFLVKVLKVIVDTVIEVLGFVIKSFVSLVKEIWGPGGTWGITGILGLAALGLLGWYLFGVLMDSQKEKRAHERAKELAMMTYGVDQ